MMKKYKKLSEMSEWELRIQKRRAMRRIAKRRKIAAVLAAVCLTLACVISYHSLTTNAKTYPDAASYKYYTGITLKSTDTLWNIADRYIDYDHYRDKAAYIEEVCSINRLDSEDSLIAGRLLIVPYYSYEYKE